MKLNIGWKVGCILICLCIFALVFYTTKKDIEAQEQTVKDYRLLVEDTFVKQTVLEAEVKQLKREIESCKNEIHK